MSTLVNIPLGLLPVLVFLVALVLLDSFKLVAPVALVRAILVGCLAALACLVVAGWMIDTLDIEASLFSRRLAPWFEETLKALYVLILIRRHRIGFLVDAAIIGFAVGTGFALIENVHYLAVLHDAGTWLWVIRGFGTAIMHGSTTAVVGILSKAIVDREAVWWPLAFLPGGGRAGRVHALYNQLVIHPLLATALILAVMPFLVIVVFEASEKATRHWLGVGFDTDAELLELITSGEISTTRVGRHLAVLRQHFSGAIVADMLCLLRVQLELSIRAKGMMLARQAGIDLPVDEDVRERMVELEFLETSVGRTGRLAMEPLLSRSRRELWELYVLGR